MTGNTTGNTRDRSEKLLRDFIRTIKLVRAQLLGISGRKVMDLQPGENDVSRLSPGVYFVRQASYVTHNASSLMRNVSSLSACGHAQAGIHKVVIQK